VYVVPFLRYSASKMA